MKKKKKIEDRKSEEDEEEEEEGWHIHTVNERVNFSSGIGG